MSLNGGPWTLGFGKIRIIRHGTWADGLRKYAIYVDDDLVGKISEHSVFEIDAPAGRHILRARLDLCFTEALGIDVAPDQVTEIEVYNRLGAFSFLLPATATIGAGRYLALRQL